MHSELPHGDVSGVHQRVPRGKGLPPRVDPAQPGGSGGNSPLQVPRWLSLTGLSAAIVIFVACNVLSSRFFWRWDVTTDGLYSLSPVTEETLAALRDEVEVVVFLSQSDPLSSSTRHMLDAYRAKTDKLRTRFVDPDRSPAEFIALQREYGIFEGRTDNGRLATEASIVVARGEARWYITTDDIVVFDEEDGSARPRLEAVLTEGIVNVLQREKVHFCFTLGHQELAIASGGPQGLSEYRRRLEGNNYDVRSVDLGVADPETSLTGCDTVVVVGPLSTFSQMAAKAVRGHLEGGGSLFLAAGPMVDEQGNIGEHGLEPLLRSTGIALGKDLIFERDEAARLPVGYGGEVFLATPLPHPTTRGLLAGESVRQRVVLQLTQSLELADESRGHALLHSSEDSVRVDSFRSLASGAALDVPEEQRQSEVLAVAMELPEYQRPSSKFPPRLVVVGTPSVLWSGTWLEPSMLGTRRFVENVTSWLAAQPALVSVPEKQSQPAGLFLTDESLSQVHRYVLLYIPFSVMLLGSFVVLRRRRDLSLGVPQSVTAAAKQKSPLPADSAGEPEPAPETEPGTGGSEAAAGPVPAAGDAGEGGDAAEPTRAAGGDETADPAPPSDPAAGSDRLPERGDKE